MRSELYVSHFRNMKTGRLMFAYTDVTGTERAGKVSQYDPEATTQCKSNFHMRSFLNKQNLGYF